MNYFDTCSKKRKRIWYTFDKLSTTNLQQIWNKFTTNSQICNTFATHSQQIRNKLKQCLKTNENSALRKLHISKFGHFEFLTFRNFEMSEFQHFGKMIFRSFEISKCWKIEISKFRNSNNSKLYGYRWPPTSGAPRRRLRRRLRQRLAARRRLQQRLRKNINRFYAQTRSRAPSP